MEKASDVSSVFYSVSTGLADIAQSAVRKSSPIPVDILAGHYPIEAQKILNQEN